MNLEREKIISEMLQKDDLKDGGLRVLVIGTDRSIFKRDSVARERMIEYGKLFQQLHIIIFTKKFQKFEIEKIAENVWIYPTRSWSRLFYPFDAVKVAKAQFGKFLTEIINVISVQDPFETAISGLLLAKKFKLPLQVQVHTDFLNQYFLKESILNKIRIIIGKYSLKRADRIRVVSKRVKDSLLLNLGENLEPKIDILPIFVDTEKMINTPANFDIKKKYPQFSFIILMASRLEKEKNIALAVGAMKDLVRNYSKIGLVIVGDGREKNKLKRLVAKYGLDKNVIFEGWQNDLISYYKTSNVFLSTSFYEGYGLTVIEALACGCPVVSSDVGIASEMVIDGENGFICAVADSNCFKRKILVLVGKPNLRISLSVNSREFVANKLMESKDGYLFEYKRIMEKCLNRF